MGIITTPCAKDQHLSCPVNEDDNRECDCNCHEELEKSVALQTCSRCDEKMSVARTASTEGEIPFCIECVGYCRGCGTTDYQEVELEHGLCYSCCDHLDEFGEL